MPKAAPGSREINPDIARVWFAADAKRAGREGGQRPPALSISRVARNAANAEFRGLRDPQARPKGECSQKFHELFPRHKKYLKLKIDYSSEYFGIVLI